MIACRLYAWIWIVQCLTSPPTQYGIWETVFTGQKTQPTVSKYWRKRPICYIQDSDGWIFGPNLEFSFY